jgi:hypothetical protein
VIAAYGSAMALIFAVFAGVLVLALLATALTPEVALRRTRHAQGATAAD